MTGLILIDPAPFKEKRATRDMSSTIRAAQEVEADGIFNHGTPTKDHRPTASGEERIQKGKGFMPEWSIAEMDEYMKSLKDGKERP